MTIYRSDVRDPLPGVKEWADTLDLTRRGLEFVGPCPLCGGDDRFHVRDSGGRAAAVPADDTPARAYLAGRSVWPPDSIGPGLPASVRWLHRGAVRRDVAADWYDVPEHTAGAIVYAFRQPSGATIRAVGLDALDGGGRQPGKRWRRTFGQKKGAVGAVGGGGAPALAPAILENRRRVVIEADPDGRGRDAALKLDAALGGRAEISWNQGGDPADVWTETLGERAAILEFDGGLSRNESEQRAWALAIERR